MSELSPEEFAMIAEAMMRQNTVSTEELLDTPYTRKELGEKFDSIQKHISTLPSQVVKPYLREVVLGNLYLEQGKSYPIQRQESRRQCAEALCAAAEKNKV